MGFQNPLRQRQGPQLPVYEKIPRDQLSSQEDDDYELTDDDRDDTSSGASSPSRDSRRTNNSSSSKTAMLKRKLHVNANLAPPTNAANMLSPILTPRRTTFTLSRRHTGRMYRLPNKITRFLCLGLLIGIILFISALVHAGVAENHRILKGELPLRPSGPNTWESFNFLTRYYGGVRTLVPFKDNIPQYPRMVDELPFNGTDEPGPGFYSGSREPTESALPTTKVFATEYPDSVFKTQKVTECFLDDEQKVKIPHIRYYDGRPAGFPQNVLGSYDVLSLPEDICFDRHGRFGPYGFGYSVRKGGLGIGEHGDREGSDLVWEKEHQVDWRSLDWSEVQRKCYQSNAGLYKPLTRRHHPPRGFYINEKLENMTLFRRDDGMPEIAAAQSPEPTEKLQTPPKEDVVGAPKTSSNIVKVPAPDEQAAEKLQSRTAIVIRCWDEYEWRQEDVLYLRSIISELSLASGGRYDVHLLVQVKNDAKYPIWADDEVYERRIKDTVPPELQSIVTLWTETQMLSLYQGIHDLWTRGKDLPVHGVYRGLQMAMQYFAYNHPEYEHFWQWEMDIRYTGHYLDLFTKMEHWAKQQPRKGLWERNGRFYLPAEHGTWEDFSQMSRVQSEMGTTGAANIWDGIDSKKKRPSELTRGEKMVWGPVRPMDPNDWFEPENDPVPPTTYEHDKYQWGVGEEADLITLNPMFDPEYTTWLLSEDITGYNETDGMGKPPRRAQIITASRMSRKLLLTMHRETAFKKHHAFPEMWPATVALQHGYKAVFVPHPLYVDREWPTQYMAAIYNGGRNGAAGGARTSVFGQREHNLQGLSWFYNSGFAPNLYRRWMGLKVNNDGGEEFELVRDMSKDESTVGQMRGGEGRMCLPPMLIHPIKGVDLPVEQDVVEEKVPESDPSA